MRGNFFLRERELPVEKYHPICLLNIYKIYSLLKETHNLLLTALHSECLISPKEICLSKEVSQNPEENIMPLQRSTLIS